MVQVQGGIPIINRREWDRVHMERAHQPVDTTSLDKWRGQLSPWQVAVTNRIAGTLLQHFGYERESNKLGLWGYVKYVFERASWRCILGWQNRFPGWHRFWNSKLGRRVMTRSSGTN